MFVCRFARLVLPDASASSAAAFRPAGELDPLDKHALRIHQHQVGQPVGFLCRCRCRFRFRCRCVSSAGTCIARPSGAARGVGRRRHASMDHEAPLSVWCCRRRHRRGHPSQQLGAPLQPRGQIGPPLRLRVEGKNARQHLFGIVASSHPDRSSGASLVALDVEGDVMGPGRGAGVESFGPVERGGVEADDVGVDVVSG